MTRKTDSASHVGADASHKSVPEWAWDRAVAEVNKYLSGEATMTKSAAKSAFVPSVKAFARYIAEHEEAPVDPLVKEAREIVAETYERLHPQATHLAASARAGEFDHHFAHEVTFTAIRRGIELAGEQK